MIFRLNLFLWLHLIPRKFHFQFQSNPDDKYQPAPFHRKWKIPVSILFFCFGDYGELGNGMFCQNANDCWWVKKKVKLWYFSGEDLEGKVCPLGVSLGNVESFTKWISNWPCSTLCYSSACKFWLLRFLFQQNTALFSTFRPPSSVRPSVRHRRDISTFLDILTVFTMKTIYFFLMHII